MLIFSLSVIIFFQAQRVVTKLVSSTSVLLMQWRKVLILSSLVELFNPTTLDSPLHGLQKEGLECHLILEERVKGSYKEDGSGNNFLFEMLGVKTKRVVEAGSNMMEEMEKTAAELKAAGKKPYIIPGGASSSIGALGYAACAEELMNQINVAGMTVDHIVVPSGSAGTHSGMVVGISGTNANIPVSGINVSRPKDVQEEIVFKLAAETAELLGVKGDIDRDTIVYYADYVGPGYSIPTDSVIEAVKLFAQEEAILLDPVYSGKAAAGLIDLVRKGVSLAILGCTELGIIASDLPLHYIDAAEVLAKEVVAVAKDQKAPHVSDMESLTKV
jgi:cysteine synthase